MMHDGLWRFWNKEVLVNFDVVLIFFWRNDYEESHYRFEFPSRYFNSGSSINKVLTAQL
jgi:hypothetical protein